MKKRILSAIALTMALSMTLGMTAFASSNTAINPSNNGDDSKSETLVVSGTITAGNVTVADDEKATLEAEAKTAAAAITNVQGGTSQTAKEVTAKDLKDAKVVAAKVAEANSISNATVTVLAAADLTIDGYEGVFTLILDKAVNPASTVVLHLNGNVWETLKTDVAADGKTITVYADSLSPIVVVEVKAGEAPAGGNNDGGSTTTSPAESPKTGAVASAAGIMAGICLAGAAVSAKKVREEN